MSKKKRPSAVVPPRNGLLPGEQDDVRQEVESLVADPESWLDTPNDQLGGEKPKTFIGTDREEQLRDLLRAIKYGIPT